MKQATILKNNVVSHLGQFETEQELNAWLEKHIAKNTFGLPERQVEVVPAVFDEQGNEVSPAQFETLPAEYEIVIEDISAQVEQQKINAEALSFLNSTDWYVVRFMEKGTPIPSDISAQREEARLKIVK